ncbi:MAG: FHIPEP family type III secretion protein [Candidatus Gastranaerophilales bacterium]|nr:FHIPEP family type III secretion protein [Candidatus Gastranaerophilales bacterium]
MIKQSHAQYCIKSCPCDDVEQLETLLNSMSELGWELYSMHEAENDDSINFNCIFVKDSSPEDDDDDSLDFLGFKSKMERIMNPALEPIDICLDIQKKIRDKRQKIAQIKSFLDSTSEDSRADLNVEMSVTLKELSDLKKKLLQIMSPDVMEHKLGEHKLSIALSEELLDIVNPDSEANLIAQIVKVRQDFTERLGYIIPKIMITEDDDLQANEFFVNVRGIPVFRATAYSGHIMYFRDDLAVSKLPKDSIKEIDYITGKNIVWIEKSKTKDYWTQGLEPREYISRAIEFVVTKHIEEIFDYSDVNRYIEIVGNQNLYLIENIIPDYLSIAELKYILANLVKEKVSIKDIMYVFEKINDFADEPSKEDLLGRLRIALARQICRSVATKNSTIQAFALDEKMTAYLTKATDTDDVVRIESSKIEKIASRIKSSIKKNDLDLQDIVLVAPMAVRHVLFIVLSQFIPNISVIAKEEIMFEYPLDVIDYV